jgi:hypothetical protein
MSSALATVVSVEVALRRRPLFRGYPATPKSRTWPTCGNENVGWLDVAMDDPSRGVPHPARRNLDTRSRSVHFEPLPGDAVLSSHLEQPMAMNGSFLLLDLVDRRDIRVIEAEAARAHAERSRA